MGDKKAPARVGCPDRGEFILFPNEKAQADGAGEFENSIMRGKGIPRLRTRELVRRDASLPATKGGILERVWHSGRHERELGRCPKPQQGRCPCTLQGTLSLDPFWLPGLSALP